MFKRLVLLLALTAGGAGPALAQAVSCVVPRALPVPKADLPDRNDPQRRMPVTGYTLALSWSPQFCATNDAPRHAMQCDGQIGQFGFVLHGLWPDGTNGKWPQYCAPAPLLPRGVIAENLCMTPSVQLLQHMWAKHGTCMARDGDAYLDRARALFQAIRFPRLSALSGRRGVRASDVTGAFARANPALPMNAMRVQASPGGMLEEVWICLDRQFKPQRCPAGKRGLASSSRLRIRL